MTRIIAYRDVVRQRVRWNRAVKAAKSFHGEQLRAYAQSCAIEYGQWVDRYFDGALNVGDALDQVSEQLMQMQAIQDVLEERAGRR